MTKAKLNLVHNTVRLLFSFKLIPNLPVFLFMLGSFQFWVSKIRTILNRRHDKTVDKLGLHVIGKVKAAARENKK